MSKIDQAFPEDYVYFVSEYDEKETLRNLGFSNQDKESMLEYNPYQPYERPNARTFYQDG